ncbi:MAG TPA: PIG-L family deacetylase [Stellaceae bacterium]|nr:PIG-L family deacetylase [Stellaceae bacterium]
MLNFRLDGGTAPLRLLCLGAHPDDIEIGCGGLLLRLLGEAASIEVRWIVFSANNERRAEAEGSARRFLGARGNNAAVEIHGFRDGFFPSEHAQIKETFEALKRDYSPSLILTHCRDDLHQDHRLVAELTFNTFRDHLVWEYEIPKYDGDMGNPNLFVPLALSLCRAKTTAILESFPSQRPRAWFTAETFMALMRLRGIGCNSPSGYAEAFYCRKAVL